MRENIINDRVLYIRNTFATEDNILLNIREKAKEINRPITINPEDGKLLQLLIKMSNCKKILEIGTFYGYSTIWMARALDDGGHIFTIEKDKPSFDVARQNFDEAKVGDKITILEGDVKDILLKLNDKFDMVFIDADKSQYLNYLELVENKIKKGGLIVADNALLSGAVYMDELPYRIRKSTRDNMIKFNKMLSDDNKYMSVLLPAEDGIVVAVKRF